jgi:hypothetical protein
MPSNIPIDGDVQGLGTVKNGEFATAPAEPFSVEFPPFLSTHAAGRPQACWQKINWGGQNRAFSAATEIIRVGNPRQLRQQPSVVDICVYEVELPVIVEATE